MEEGKNLKSGVEVGEEEATHWHVWW